jgi:putative toxin-antitoxin system antitoxin component (TIGR02293 family)
LLRSLRLDLESIEAGAPVETITRFLLASGVELKDTYDVVIPCTHIQASGSSTQPLSADESHRLARFVHVFDQAVSVLGDVGRARTWLRTQKTGLTNADSITNASH